MEVADKAVSTEDLCLDRPHNTSLEVAKLEAVLNTLVENKVEAIKNETKSSSIHSSPKAIINRLRITSTSTASSKDKDEQSEGISQSFENADHRRRKDRKLGARKNVRTGHTKKRRSTLSLDKSKYSLQRCCEKTPPGSDEEGQEELEFLKYENFCNVELCIPAGHNNIGSCCCNSGRNGQIMSFEEDYVSLKIEDYEDIEDHVVIAQKSRTRRKRRRKKRRHKRQIAITAIPIEDSVKVIDPDELPQRARWTIVATAFLLLFMCLLLVGVTLRMAPIIDDMVRKENEELMNSLHRDHGHSIHNSTSPVPL